MKTCEECGLPILICNALANYRWAVKWYEAGNKADAVLFASDAKTYYEKYVHELDHEKQDAE
jgi:hypothetical protein